MIARLLTSPAARVVITATILFYLFRHVDWLLAWRVMVGADSRWLTFTLVMVAADRAVMAWRWLMLLRAGGVQLEARRVVEIFLVSSFVGSVVPAGIGADVARAYAVTTASARGDGEGRGGESVASVGVDRILGVVACVGLGAFALVGWAQHFEEALRLRVSAGAALVGVGAVATLWLDRFIVMLWPARWRSHLWGWRLGRLGEGVAAYRRQPAVLLAVLGLSVGVQLLRVLQGYGVGRALGLDVPLAFYLVFMPIVLLLLLLPVSISGFGLPQAAMVWILTPAGVPDAAAFAMSTLFILAGLAGNLPGAFLYLRRTKPVT